MTFMEGKKRTGIAGRHGTGNQKAFSYPRRDDGRSGTSIQDPLMTAGTFKRLPNTDHHLTIIPSAK